MKSPINCVLSSKQPEKRCRQCAPGHHSLRQRPLEQYQNGAAAEGKKIEGHRFHNSRQLLRNIRWDLNAGTEEEHDCMTGNSDGKESGPSIRFLGPDKLRRAEFSLAHVVLSSDDPDPDRAVLEYHLPIEAS